MLQIQYSLNDKLLNSDHASFLKLPSAVGFLETTHYSNVCSNRRKKISKITGSLV